MRHCNSSMQLTRAADYGVRVMIQLAKLPAHERALLPDLARTTESPMSFLSKVLQALTRAHLISSRRGKSGGFSISTRGREASMCDVIEAVDGPICLNICLVSGKSCARKESCPAHPVWGRAQEAMLEVLRATTIVELAREAEASHELKPAELVVMAEA